MRKNNSLHLFISHVPVFLIAVTWLITPTIAEDPLSYSRDVRPILAKRCFVCHGPDEAAREADLRLDSMEGATADLGGYRAIVPGDPDQSEAITRITSSDDDDRMPPPEAKMEMSDLEKETIRRWIAEGATYEQHWAFIAPQNAEIPTVQSIDQVKNSIDHFVLARIEQAGLQPSPEANRYTLVRRLYLDLIGLPPTVAEADAFVNDSRPDAYDRLVDTLLDSPHYGERWARLWLDLARYADTNGYEKDRPRSVWAYRDWVINALNDDMPFDQFTIEQLAGDLLPNATLDQQTATGFHRNTMLNEEGGIEVEQFRFESIIDRVNTTGTVWLGVTIGCAQCHSHKYDPISQQEYYRLFAFLNNADEPTLDLPDPSIEQQRTEARQPQLETEWPSGPDQPRLEDELQGWLASKREVARHWETLHPMIATSSKGTTFTVLEDDSLLAGGNYPNNDVYTIEIETDLPRITALKLEVLPHESLPAGGPGRAPISVGEIITKGDFLLSEIEVQAFPRHGTADPVSVSLVDASEDYAKEKSSAALALDGNFDTGWRIGDETGKPHHAVFPFAEPITFNGGARLVVKLHQIYIHNMTIGRFRLSATSDSLPIKAAGVPANIEVALLLPEDQRSDEQHREMRYQFLLDSPLLAEQQKAIDTLRREMPQYETTLVMQERAPRGEYLKPREEVTPGVPEMLHSLSADAPLDRLALARWLVDDRNPLVARVVMNRHWQAFFGAGIVRTTEDFGTQSSPPTHPKLLDWLALEFMNRGWSLKTMHRLIVTSATYRQQSYITPELLERDPENLLLARGPRFRVDAEMVRDIALVAAGLLHPKIGGPSVFPPQPEGVTNLSYGTFKWETSQGPDRYRRGLYTFAKRTTPYAMFGTFDGPSGETCVVRRNRSNTPLQALTLLNDSGFVEAAQSLALKAIIDGPPTTEARIVDIFRRFLTRPPDAEELDAILKFHDEQLTRFSAQTLNAAEVAGMVDKQLPANVALEELAALTTVVRAVLNFDESITKE